MNARRMHGQALTEFVVVALVLIPLFLVLPMIGKYFDIAHATQMASRYAAFDAMHRNSAAKAGWKPATQLAGEVQRRYFSNSDAPVKTGDTAGDFSAHRNAFWVDNQGKPLIREFGKDVGVSFGLGAGQSSHEAGFAGASDTLPFGLVGNTLDFPDEGIYTANVTVRLAKPDAPADAYSHAFDLLSKLDLSMTRHTSLALGPWAAPDYGHANDRIDKPLLFHGHLLAPVRGVVDAAVVIVESPSCLGGGCVRGPKLGELEFWEDVVPQDRLK